MLNRLAHALLVATALAPVALVHAAAGWPHARAESAAWVAVAAVLVASCVALLAFARAQGEREVVSVGEARNVDEDVLAFLVSYALPLVTPPEHPGSAFALAAFVALVAVVLYQTGLVHVNPLLGMLGYRFHEVTPEGGGEPALLVTRARAGAGGRRTVVKLSAGLWLEVR